ncbi:MAG: DUF6443 domain-containing protein [Bacteroidota bacterium]
MSTIVASRWFLSSIENPTFFKNRIVFKYDQTWNQFQRLNANYVGQAPNQDIDDRVTGHGVKGTSYYTYLRSVESNTEKIEFTNSFSRFLPAHRRLVKSAVLVNKQSGEHIKMFAFEYQSQSGESVLASYYATSYVPLNQKKIFLRSVKEVGVGTDSGSVVVRDSSKPSYRFDYISFSGSTLTNNPDMWGFDNFRHPFDPFYDVIEEFSYRIYSPGIYTGTKHELEVQFQDYDVTPGGLPNLEFKDGAPYSANWSLKSMTYPTGLKKEFYYRPAGDIRTWFSDGSTTVPPFSIDHVPELIRNGLVLKTTPYFPNADTLKQTIGGPPVLARILMLDGMGDSVFTNFDYRNACASGLPLTYAKANVVYNGTTTTVDNLKCLFSRYAPYPDVPRWEQVPLIGVTVDFKYYVADLITTPISPPPYHYGSGMVLFDDPESPTDVARFAATYYYVDVSHISQAQLISYDSVITWTSRSADLTTPPQFQNSVENPTAGLTVTLFANSSPPGRFEPDFVIFQTSHFKNKSDLTQNIALSSQSIERHSSTLSEAYSGNIASGTAIQEPYGFHTRNIARSDADHYYKTIHRKGPNGETIANDEGKMYTESSCLSTRLISETVVADSVTLLTAYQYVDGNTSAFGYQRIKPYSTVINLEMSPNLSNLPKSRTSQSNGQALQQTTYRYFGESADSAFLNRNIIVPIESLAIRNNANQLIYCEVNDWGKTIGSSTFLGPVFRGQDVGGIRQKSVLTYDSAGHITEIQDGNGNRSRYYYGTASTPFANVGAGLTNPYLTGVQRIKGEPDGTPFGGDDLWSSATYNTRGNVVQMNDENNTFKRFSYDCYDRLRYSFAFPSGVKRLFSESKYFYSRNTDLSQSTFSADSPNRIETITYPGACGYDDFSTNNGWTTSGTVLFNQNVFGTNAVRVNPNATLSRSLGPSGVLVRADVYVKTTDIYDCSTSIPYKILILIDSASSSNKIEISVEMTDPVDLNTFSCRFYVQETRGGSSNRHYFDIIATGSGWFTCEIEKVGSGQSTVYVSPQGSGRNESDKYTTTLFTTQWTSSLQSQGITIPLYLAHSIVGASASTGNTLVYFDGMSRERQRQVKTDEGIVVNASAYDLNGQKTISTKPRDYATSAVYKSGMIAESANWDFGNAMTSSDINAIYNGQNGYSNDQGYPYELTEYEADPLGRVRHVHGPGPAAMSESNGHFVKYAYTKATSTDSSLFSLAPYSAFDLHKTIVTDENGVSTVEFRDKLDRIAARVVDPANLKHVTKFEYDAAGRVTRATDPSGLQTSYGYDSRGLLTEKTTPNGGTSELLYDKNGNLRFLKDGNHQGYQTTTTGSTTTASEGAYIYGDDYRTGSFTVDPGGTVNVSLNIYNQYSYYDDIISLVITDGSSNQVYLIDAWGDHTSVTGSIELPTGTYSYSVTTVDYNYAGYLESDFSISYPTTTYTTHYLYSFIYNKYDAFNRVTEAGEHVTESPSYFAQTYVDNASFPGSDLLLDKSYLYDTASTDYPSQRNLKGKLSVSTSYERGSLAWKTFYSYDDLGRVEWMIERNSGGKVWKLTYAYDLQGRVTKKGFIDPANSTNDLYTFYQFDPAGRLKTIYTGRDGSVSGEIKEAEFLYFPSGQVKQLNLGNSPVQVVDYTYNERGWLKTINDMPPSGSDVFAESVGYFDSVFASAKLYNGNVSAVKLYNGGVTSNPYIGFKYSYDGANRLMSAQTYETGSWSISNNYTLDSVRYLANGDIKSLGRRNRYGNGLDYLAYTYTNNTSKLSSVYNSATASNQTYSYDSNGNAISDSYRGINSSAYSISNLPITMNKSTGSAVAYRYDANGNRIWKQEGSSGQYYVPGIEGQTEAVYDANGNLRYWNITANGQLVGRIEPQ